jgi:beta-N-acetylhexosaminidase
VNSKEVFPLSAEKAGRVLLAGNFSDFFTYGRKAFPGALTYFYDTNQASTDIIYYARNVDTVIFCLSNKAGIRILQQLRSLNKRVIVFSVLSPAYIDEVPWADGAVAVYSYAPESFIAGFSAILGRIKGEGKLPFTLNMLYLSGN